MRRTTRLAVSLASLALAGPVLGQEPPADRPASDRVTLTVDGRAVVPADRVDVELVVMGQGEASAEAETSHRTKLRAVLRALDDLKEEMQEEAAAKDGAKDAPKETPKETPKEEAKEEKPPAPEKPAAPAAEPFTVELQERGTMFGLGASFTGPNNQRVQTNVSVASVVVVRMSGLASLSRVKVRKRVARILDASLEAGVEAGARDARLRPALRFRAKDEEALREEAYKVALARGRDRAGRLARLGGRELGPLAGVVETAWSLRANRAEYRGPVQGGTNRWVNVVHQQRRADGQGLGALLAPADELTTAMTEVELDVTLTVEFELGKPTEK